MKLKIKFAVFSLALSIICCGSLGAYAEVLTNFRKVNDYSSSTYTDVPFGSWYYYYAGFAYEYGIMTGVSQNIFSPEGNLTLAEAITIAARLNASYYGNTIDMLGLDVSLAPQSASVHYTHAANAQLRAENYDSVYRSPKTTQYLKADNVAAPDASTQLDWFIPYLSYAYEQGIVTELKSGNAYMMPATREELAGLLYRAMPGCYNKINDITPIPDVDPSNLYYHEILSLYEAGVITGNDEYGTFYPYAGITRCEVSAMVSRAVNTDLRVSFALNPNMPHKLLSFSWRYPYYSDERFNMTLEISYYDYSYFASKPRTNDYSAYARDAADVTGLTLVANTLKDMALSNGFDTDYEIAGFVSAFVQSLEYMDDYEYKGVAEYPKYPFETLFEQGGDCEDTSVLLAKLLNILGYGTVLLVSDNHMAVGLQTYGNGNITIDGVKFYYIETTEESWRVGEVPADMIGTGMAAIYI